MADYIKTFGHTFIVALAVYGAWVLYALNRPIEEPSASIATTTSTATSAIQAQPNEPELAPQGAKLAPRAPEVKPTTPLSPFDAAILADMNAARKAQGLALLTEDARLDRVAHDKIEDLQHGPFDHKGTDGQPSWHWFASEGYRYVYNGENLAKGFSDPEAAFAAYMASPEHRANILNPQFKDVGLSSMQMPDGTMEAVEFGEPSV